MTRTAKIVASLAQPIRLKALCLLWDGKERCVCELMETLGTTQSRMSRHMAVLKEAGLVIDRRDAQWVRYRRNPKLPHEKAAIVRSILKALEKEEIFSD